MNKTCFIHIGAPKTGSTALQSTFHEMRGKLRDQGVLYPSASVRGFGHHDLAFLIGGGYPEWATPQGHSLEELVRDIANEIDNYDGDILISSENFYLFPNPRGLKSFLAECGLLDTHQVRIIVYVRRQDRASESWYNQSVKALGYSGFPERFIAENLLLWDYYAQLNKWAEVFSDNALIVRRYKEDWKGSDALLRDFCSILELSLSDCESSCRRSANISLSRDLLEFQRLINHLPLSPVNKRRFHKQLMKMTSSGRFSGSHDKFPVILLHDRNRILEHYRDGNAKVARQWFESDELFPEYDCSLGNQEMTYPGLTVGTCASILAGLIGVAWSCRGGADAFH